MGRGEKGFDYCVLPQYTYAHHLPPFLCVYRIYYPLKSLSATLVLKSQKVTSGFKLNFRFILLIIY